jgi:hypothetical protein
MKLTSLPQLAFAAERQRTPFWGGSEFTRGEAWNAE